MIVDILAGGDGDDGDGDDFAVVESGWLADWKAWVDFDVDVDADVEDGDADDGGQHPSPGRPQPQPAGDATSPSRPPPPPPPPLEREPPPPIDNSGLVVPGPDADGECAVLRPGLAENVDLELVPGRAYDLLERWYGGGPCLRRAPGELYVVARTLLRPLLLLLLLPPPPPPPLPRPCHAN